MNKLIHSAMQISAVVLVLFAVFGWLIFACDMAVRPLVSIAWYGPVSLGFAFIFVVALVTGAATSGR